MNDINLATLARIARIAGLVEQGRYLEASEQAIELGLDLAPVDQLRPYLDAGAARRANDAADALERLKFNG